MVEHYNKQWEANVELTIRKIEIEIEQYVTNSLEIVEGIIDLDLLINKG